MIDSADNATHPLPVTGAMRVRFADAAGNLLTIDLGQDLLGDWVVTSTWSDTRQRGGARRLLVSDQEAGLQLLQQIARSKQRSGFVPVLDYHVPTRRD